MSANSRRARRTGTPGRLADSAQRHVKQDQAGPQTQNESAAGFSAAATVPSHGSRPCLT